MPDMRNNFAAAPTSKLEVSLSCRHALEHVASAIFSLLMMAVPWERLAGRGFEDRSVYLEKFAYLKSVLEEQSVSGLLGFYTNEVLWDSGVRAVAQFFDLQYDTVLYAVTFLCLFSSSLFVLRNSGSLSILLLINPLVVDFAFSQLRLAMSASLLIFAFSLRRRVAAGLVIVAACFIHSATILFVLMYAVATWVCHRLRERRISLVSANVILICCGFFIAMLIGPFREELLQFIGDRRAEYTAAASTIGYASFWILMLLLTPFQGKKLYSDRYSMVAVICVAAFVGSTFFGVFGLRFLSALFPLIVVAILRFDRPVREITILGLVGYVVIQWIYWLR